LIFFGVGSVAIFNELNDLVLGLVILAEDLISFIEPEAFFVGLSSS